MLDPPPRQRRHLRTQYRCQAAIALLIIVFSFFAIWYLQQEQINPSNPTDLKRLIYQAGGWGPLVYIAVLAVSVVVSQIPGVPLAMVAGAIWGAIAAGVYSVIGGFLGAMIAYFLGRTLGRPAIKTITGKAIYFSKHRGEVYMGWLIFITRLLPVLSFDLISYAAGITRLSIPIYAAATFFGMIPSTFLLTYMGSAITMNATQAIVLAILFLVVLVGLPWGIQRYNWLGLRGVVRIE